MVEVSYVLEQAQVVADANRAGRDSTSLAQLSNLIANMNQTIATAARTFCRFHQLGDDLLHATLAADLESSHIASIEERRSVLTPKGAVSRSLIAYQHLPPPIHLAIWAVAISIITLIGNALYHAPVEWIVAGLTAYGFVFLYFMESLKEWFRSRL